MRGSQRRLQSQRSALGNTFSKETEVHDHIYAAYAMSKHKIQWLEQPSNGIDITELMLATACAVSKNVATFTTWDSGVSPAARQ